MSFTILGLVVTISRAPLAETVPAAFRRPTSEEILQDARFKALMLHALGEIHRVR